MRYFFLVITVTFLCRDLKGQDAISGHTQSALHKIVVMEKIQTTAYTYALVAEENDERWLAVTKSDPEIGAVYYYLGEMEMKNFRSKELDRTFETVTFIEKLVSEQVFNEGEYPIKGGTTIANLFINKKDYDGEIVRVRGKVTKFNDDILGKNWIHLNDGTNELGNRDFVVTSQSTVEVGDLVTFEGKIAINLDLGYGYLYEVIMEDGKILE